MLDLALLLYFSFHLHRLAASKGLPPWKPVMQFVLTYFGILLFFSFWLIWFFGVDTFSAPEKLKAIAPYLPMVLALEVSLFLYFRYKLSKLPPADANDNNDADEASPEGKDLSYFR
jgi:hypothetical protein